MQVATGCLVKVVCLDGEQPLSVDIVHVQHMPLGDMGTLE